MTEQLSDWQNRLCQRKELSEKSVCLMFGETRDSGTIVFYVGDSDWEVSLELIGGILGNEGWSRELRHDARGFHYARQFNGVRIVLWDAESITPTVSPAPTPVDPSLFGASQIAA